MAITKGSFRRTGRKSQVVTLASAVAITDVTAYNYDLMVTGGLTEAQVRDFSEFQISFESTFTNAGSNANMTVTVFSTVRASGTGASSGRIYTEAGALANGTSRLILSANTGGTGVDATTFRTVAALKGIFSNLHVRVQAANAPTSGSITIAVECVV